MHLCTEVIKVTCTAAVRRHLFALACMHPAWPPLRPSRHGSDCGMPTLERANLRSTIRKEALFPRLPTRFGQPIRLSDGSGAFHHFGPLGDFEA